MRESVSGMPLNEKLDCLSTNVRPFKQKIKIAHLDVFILLVQNIHFYAPGSECQQYTRCHICSAEKKKIKL